MENQPTATTDNPYGLAALWATGDIIARAVLVLLLIMSLASWYVMLTKLWDQRKLKQSARVVERQFWSAPSIRSEEHTSELQSHVNLVCRLLLEKKKGLA